MEKKKRGLSIAVKLYFFIFFTVLAVSIGTAIQAYRINADQIDRYYKQAVLDSARSFSSFVDGDYMAELREAVESEEFQSLRETAEKTEDESLIQDYLEKNGLWDRYVKIREDLMKFLANMEAVRYLYIIACGDAEALYDMYLIDDDETPIYETGYYEKREEAFLGKDLSTSLEPTISTGDWGWLCSTYVPVYDSKGRVVCQVGCDYGMDEVMTERHMSLLYIILSVVLLTGIVLVCAVILITRIVIKPLNLLTVEMGKFKPSVDISYKKAGVANLEIRSHDEIEILYQGIRAMQINIIDYLNDMDTLQKDIKRVEEDIRARDEQIGQMSKEVYRDELTGVGSKAAYIRKIEELSREIKAGDISFSIVIVDMNDLKRINDKYGHKMGDFYINGCCHLICEHFKHSPVYRIGGDEFVIILKGVDYENRVKLVESLKNSYAQTYANPDVKPWERYSAAVGMADLASDDKTIDLVFKRADKAMYEDKHRFKMEHGSYR
ncbi:MAG: diguanylate cyclase [Blautia sp.]|nr:diguanylate cyclase [Blautia sp.]